MKIKSFIKLLTRKINKYDKASTNPFGKMPVSITLVWVEENKKDFCDKSKFNIF